MDNSKYLKWIMPSIKTRTVPSNISEDVFNFRIEKAKEQLTKQAVDIEIIVEYVNEFLCSLGMGKIESGKAQVVTNKSKLRRIDYAKIYLDNINGMERKENIVWIKFSIRPDDKKIISVIGTGCDIFFTQKTKDETTAGRINQYLNLEWDDSIVLIFPLIRIPKGLNRSDIESGIGNYLIFKGVPILDFYSHNY